MSVVSGKFVAVIALRSRTLLVLGLRSTLDEMMMVWESLCAETAIGCSWV